MKREEVHQKPRNSSLFFVFGTFDRSSKLHFTFPPVHTLFILFLAIMPLHDLVNASSTSSTPSGAGTSVGGGVRSPSAVEVTTKENLVDPATTATTTKDIGGGGAVKDSDSTPLTTTPATILDDHSSTGSLRSEDDDDEEDDDVLVAVTSQPAVGTAAIQKTEHKLAEEAGLHLTEPLLVENPHRFVLFPIQDNEVRLPN
jgi:hypothetical protein